MNNVKIDKSSIDEILKKLNPENRNKLMMQALIKGAIVLKKQAESELIKTGIRCQNVSKTTKKRMIDGIKIKKDTAYNDVSVHIMGDFRLKYFERVTNVRIGKNKASRGSIKATHFFQKARQNDAKIKQEMTDFLNSKI